MLVLVALSAYALDFGVPLYSTNYCSDPARETPDSSDRHQLPREVGPELPIGVNVRRVVCVATESDKGVYYASAFPEELDTFTLAMEIVTQGGLAKQYPSVASDQLRYSEAIDLDALREVLHAEPDVPPRAEREFVDSVRRAIDANRTRVAALTPAERVVFFDPIQAAVAEERAAAPAIAAKRAEADAWLDRASHALLDRKVPASLVDEGLAMRDAWIAECSQSRPVAHCFGDPIARPLTARLVDLAKARGDRPLAYAEADLLARTHDRTDPRVAIRTAIAEQQDISAGVMQERARARQAGLSTAEIDERYGPEVEAYLLEASIGAGLPSTWRDPTADRPDVIDRDVTKVSTKGGSTTITFAYRVWNDHYSGSDCHETDRIVGVDYSSSGYATVVYDVVCYGPPVDEKKNDKIAPVVVPVREAVGIEPGMRVSVLVDAGKTARVLEVRDVDGKVVQRHGFAL